MNETESSSHILVDKCKKNAWRIITPAFPYVRDILIKLGVIYHEGRQRYPIGWLANNLSMYDINAHLEMQGFTNDLIAWVDTDESISLRRLANFHWQYHIRIYHDGEIRGHYELTPEAHPIAHFKEVGMEPRREEFLKFLGDLVVASNGQTAIMSGKTAPSRAPAASRVAASARIVLQRKSRM